MTVFAWAGGVAFVASLAYFFYTYAVTFSVPGGSAGTGIVPALVTNCLLFLVFAGHHSLLARAGAKRWMTRLVSRSLERSVYVWVASVLLAVVCAAWRPLPGWAYHVTGPLAWPLMVLVAAGVGLTAAGSRLLNPLELAGISQVRRRGAGGRAASGRTHALVTRFPYSVVRHPIYLGWMLAVFAVPAMTWNRLLMAALSSAYLLVAVPWEERLLASTLGEAYEAYRRRVRWRIVPFLY